MEYTVHPGDHIFFSAGTHSHHGIYCGDISYKNRHYKNVVIHYENKFKTGQIRGLCFNKFVQRAGDNDIYIAQYKKGTYYRRQVVVRRAIDKLTEQDYNLFFNNCEHFAHWCKTGKYISSQVNRPIGIFGGLVSGIVASVCLPISTPIVGAIAAGAIAGGLGSKATELFTGSPDYEYE